MTLTRSNPEDRLAVIDRTDDSVARPIRVAVVGKHGLFVDAVINALLGSRISAWRTDRDLPTMALVDLLEQQRPELVLFGIGAAGDDAATHRLIGHLTQRKLPVVLMSTSSDPAVARRWLEAGATSVVNPTTAAFEELTAAVRAAAARDSSPAGDWRRRLDEARRSAQARLRDLDGATIISFDDAPH